MRKAICAVVLLALITPAFAADKFAGTWKINTEKSTGPATVQQLVCEQEGDGYVYTVTGKTPDGAPITNKFSVPAKGGAGKIIDAEPYTGVTARPATASAQDVTFMKDGKPAMHVHSVMSSDGKTMTSTVRVIMDARQKPGTHKDVWEKQ